MRLIGHRLAGADFSPATNRLHDANVGFHRWIRLNVGNLAGASPIPRRLWLLAGDWIRRRLGGYATRFLKSPDRVERSPPSSASPPAARGESALSINPASLSASMSGRSRSDSSPNSNRNFSVVT